MTAVDLYMNGPNAEPVFGPSFSFFTDNAAPEIVIDNVYADSCEAAKSVPGFELIPGELNENCVVNDLDLAILEANWLKCNALDCSGLVDPNAVGG